MIGEIWNESGDRATFMTALGVEVRSKMEYRFNITEFILRSC